MKPRFKSKYILAQLFVVPCILLTYLNACIDQQIDGSTSARNWRTIRRNKLKERSRQRQLTKQYSQVVCPFCANEHQDP
jgi:hypothetical protein